MKHHTIYTSILRLPEILKDSFHIEHSSVYKNIKINDFIDFHFHYPDFFISDKQVSRLSNLTFSIKVNDILYDYGPNQEITSAILKF